MQDIELKEIYIDPRTNFGVKYLFGTPMNKDVLIGFLNALFHGTHTITDLTYLNGEQLGIHRLFEAASIARFTPKQLREYEDSVKAYRDIVNAVSTARKEGLEEGERKKQIEIARTLKGMGMDISAIHQATGLDAEEIKKL